MPLTTVRKARTKQRTRGQHETQQKRAEAAAAT